mgnify:CR=1 FL=1
MKTLFFSIVLGLLAFSGTVLKASSEESDPGAAVPTGVSDFLKEWAGAGMRRDPRALKTLVHPEILAEFSDANRDFFEYTFSHELLLPLTERYRIEECIPYSEDLTPLLADVFDYPVQPSHRLKIIYRTPGGETVEAMRDIARKDGTWYLVYPVPDEESLRLFRRSGAAEMKEKELAALLYRELDDPLKTELEELAADGKIEEAALLYSGRTGHFPGVSRRVAALIEKQEN